jgi:hypothetical protein
MATIARFWGRFVEEMMVVVAGCVGPKGGNIEKVDFPKQKCLHSRRGVGQSHRALDHSRAGRRSGTANADTNLGPLGAQGR